MKYIKKFYSQEVLYIPIEILIYNIVTFSPSPLNCDVKLNLRSSFENGEYKTVISNVVQPNKRHHKNVVSFTSSENLIKVKKNNTINIDNCSSKSQKHIKRNKTKYINPKKEDDFTIKFNFLSGYPLIQYNLSKFYSTL
jgi:hypothetical protein